MALGFLLAALTGLTWTLIGVVLSRCAKGGVDIISYSLMQTGITAAGALLLYVKPSAVNGSDWLIPVLAVFGGGMLNSAAQMVVKTAMTRGNHGPVWGIVQSSLIVPFLAGAVLWGVKGSAWQWCGTALIAGGILTPVIGKFGDFRRWLLPALLAFLLLGAVQTLYSVPSQLAYADSGGLRPLLVAGGGLAGWELVRRRGRMAFSPNGKTLRLALLMAALSLVSLKLFFLGLDYLSRAGAGNIGIPLIVGCNIAGFSLYSLLLLRERLSRIEIAGMLAVLAGIIVIAIR